MSKTLTFYAFIKKSSQKSYIAIDLSPYLGMVCLYIFVRLVWPLGALLTLHWTMSLCQLKYWIKCRPNKVIYDRSICECAPGQRDDDLQLITSLGTTVYTVYHSMEPWTVCIRRRHADGCHALQSLSNKLNLWPTHQLQSIQEGLFDWAAWVPNVHRSTT